MTTTQTGSTVAAILVLVMVGCAVVAVLASGAVGYLMSHSHLAVR